ncbi:MAG TPA: dihydroorotate dehydrogenase electron transfer subunit [Bacteroidales bacterium]|nr:dihydroorotate dehydrogenase electron transfer subunit [Bacteroidales bacterium]HRZ49610.1 dihydroorotate dehydrogenase electron transfer subunit [Bacteroidales bacterium]
MPRKTISTFSVSEVIHLSPDTFVMHLQGVPPLPEVFAGQFAEVEVPGSPDVFLRRPLSIHAADRERGMLSFYVKTVGKGTRRLSELLPGEKVSVVYPLGNQFTLLNSGKVLLVAGGTGVAPMLMLAQSLKGAGAEPTLLIGGRSASDIHVTEAYHEAAEVLVTTEDGSAGIMGRVTDHPVLKENFDFVRICTCGPDPMMKALAVIAREKHVICEASLENTMACGFGACLCCVVKTTEGHKCVCTEGPVFDTRNLENW